MTKAGELKKLGALAQLTLDHRLGRMRASSGLLELSKAQLAAITAAPAPQTDLPPVIGAKAEFTYQRWADLRRSELNLVIARQTADWLTARDEARLAFGRLSALQGLAARLARPLAKD